MRTDFGMLDAWHWKAALTNPLGFTDDKHFTAAGSGVSGRKGDDGLSSHFDNGTETVPGFQALSGAQGALSMQPVVNVAPQASAGQNQAVGGGISVNLNGSASFDPNGYPLTYAWVQTAGPVVALTGANTATPSFRRAHGPSWFRPVSIW